MTTPGFWSRLRLALLAFWEVFRFGRVPPVCLWAPTHLPHRTRLNPGHAVRTDIGSRRE